MIIEDICCISVGIPVGIWDLGQVRFEEVRGCWFDSRMVVFGGGERERVVEDGCGAKWEELFGHGGFHTRSCLRFGGLSKYKMSTQKVQVI